MASKNMNKGQWLITKSTELNRHAFLEEILDVFNEDLIEQRWKPVAFDHGVLKEFAVCVLCTSMVGFTDQIEELPLIQFTCVCWKHEKTTN
jgi:hypothetical protein